MSTAINGVQACEWRKYVLLSRAADVHTPCGTLSARRYARLKLTQLWASHACTPQATIGT